MEWVAAGMIGNGEVSTKEVTVAAECLLSFFISFFYFFFIGPQTKKSASVTCTRWRDGEMETLLGFGALVTGEKRNKKLPFS